MQRALAVVLLFLALAVAACSGGGGGSSVPPPTVPPPPPLATVLNAPGSAVAVAALPSKTATAVAASDESHGYLLTRLIVLLQANATVDQFNAAARSVNASNILSARPNAAALTLEVPRQTDIAALRALARTLRSQPGIADAFAAKMLAPSMLPPTGGGQPAASLSHLLATRFPQAWNAHGAAGGNCSQLQGRPVPVFVADRFGPSSAALVSFASEPLVLLGPTGDDPAGYHGMRVALTIAGEFDADAPTGTSPFAHCVQIHAVNSELTDAVSASYELVTAVTAETGHFILNMSLNFADPSICGPFGNDSCTPDNSQRMDVEDVRDELIERAVLAQGLIEHLTSLGGVSTERMLVTVSAGNVAETDVEGAGFFALRFPGFRDARFSNPFTLATHLNEIDALLQNAALWTDSETPTRNAAFDAEALARLHRSLQAAGTTTLDRANVIVADSGTAAESADAVTPSDFDFQNADVRAVADPVKLTGVDNPSDLSQTQFAGAGTSLAAAQAAGLAAYLWSLSPDLANGPAADTQRLILRTARKHAGVGLLGVPLLDAYAAALALDQPNGTPKVRRALLDANDDGRFDQQDLALFAQAYELTNPNRPTIPAARDFGRFDLNGDGYTGGIITAAFDLDVAGLDAGGLPSIGSVEQGVESYDVDFNEAALSDLQVLCYYAYADVNGDPAQPRFYANTPDDLAQRSAILGTRNCIGARLDVQLGVQITAAAPIKITVAVPAGQGQFAPAPNVLVELTPTCATVSPLSGRTDANGAISASVTPTAGCTSVSIEVLARAAAGTAPLAQSRATATVGQQHVFTGRYEVTSYTDLSLPNPPRDIPLTFNVNVSPDIANGFQLISHISCGIESWDLTVSNTAAGVDFVGTMRECGQITVQQPSPQHFRGSWSSASGELHLIQFHDVLPDGGQQDDVDYVLLPCSNPAKPGFIECSSLF